MRRGSRAIIDLWGGFLSESRKGRAFVDVSSCELFGEGGGVTVSEINPAFNEENKEQESTRGWKDRGKKRDSIRIRNRFRCLFAEIREGK